MNPSENNDGTAGQLDMLVRRFFSDVIDVLGRDAKSPLLAQLEVNGEIVEPWADVGVRFARDAIKTSSAGENGKAWDTFIPGLEKRLELSFGKAVCKLKLHCEAGSGNGEDFGRQSVVGPEYATEG